MIARQSQQRRYRFLLLLCVGFCCPVAVLLAKWAVSPSSSSAVLRYVVAPTVGVAPIFRVGSYILTSDQNSLSLPVNCSLGGRWCVGERLGRFAVSCECLSVKGNVNLLSVDGNMAAEMSISTQNSFINNKRLFLGACSMVRGEVDYLKEWLDFHLLQGIELFVLYSDEDDNTETRIVLQPYIQRKQVVFVDFRLSQGPERQFVAVNHCVQIMMQHVEWVAVFDVDEFFVPMKFESLKVRKIE
jgi:hypothetical protein